MQLSDANVYANFALKLFQDNNPLMGFVQWFTAMAYQLATHRSNVKLNHYRKSLYSQQLEKMESYLTEGSVYQFNGRKLNRRY